MHAHSSPDPGTKTVELLGFCFTLATALSSDAFLSLSSFVCWANLRSSRREIGVKCAAPVAAHVQRV